MTKPKTTTPTNIVAFKGFDKNLACRDFQFEVGAFYAHDGKVIACQSGFHAVTDPMDVWSYYPPGETNRYARVTLSGATATHAGDSKVAASHIVIEAELTASEFTKLCVEHLVTQTKGKGDDPSGDSARIGSSGDSARIGSSGYSAQIGSSGYSAQIGSSGDSAQIGSSGHNAQIEASGKDAVIACAGSDATVQAGEGGAICIPYHDGKRVRFAIGYVGEDGIEPGVAYRAKSGKLVAV